MTMAVFDYSDIKARMERREPTKPADGGVFYVCTGTPVISPYPCDFAVGGHDPIPASDPDRIPLKVIWSKSLADDKTDADCEQRFDNALNLGAAPVIRMITINVQSSVSADSFKRSREQITRAKVKASPDHLRELRGELD